jgi:hypothetical protein
MLRTPDAYYYLELASQLDIGGWEIREYDFLWPLLIVVWASRP